MHSQQVWRGMRWITDVVSAARDRQLSNRCSLPLSTLFDYDVGESGRRLRKLPAEATVAVVPAVIRFG